jgi:hypothetical protein
MPKQQSSAKSNILLALSSVYDSILDKSTAYSFLQQHLNLKKSIEIANNEKLALMIMKVSRKSNG